MLATRIKTAVLILIPVSLALVLGGWFLKALLLLVYVAVQHEMLSFTPQLTARERLTTLVMLVLLPMSYLGWGLPAAGGAFVAVSIGILSSQVLSMERDAHEQNRLDSLAVLALALAYTAPLCLSLIVSTEGVSRQHLWWLLLEVIAADTGAYFTGRALGGPLMSPRVSPKKTIAGGVGGLVFAGLVSFCFNRAVPLGLHPFESVAWGVFVGVLCIFGDLVESLVKRTFQKKDSGSLLPGHGGVLDRVDALLFAAPVLYFFRM